MAEDFVRLDDVARAFRDALASDVMERSAYERIEHKRIAEQASRTLPPDSPMLRGHGIQQKPRRIAVRR